jgi:hypothetical protein
MEFSNAATFRRNKHRIELVTTSDQTFTLYELFALTHFDASRMTNPPAYRQDALTIEQVIHRAATHAYSKQSTAEAKAIAVAFLAETQRICKECLESVTDAAKVIDEQYLADPLVGALPEKKGVECALRWNDERMWILVRALLVIDKGHRQLRRLQERGAIDIGQVKKQRHPLVHPFRVAVAAILRLSAQLPQQAKGILKQPVSAGT